MLPGIDLLTIKNVYGRGRASENLREVGEVQLVVRSTTAFVDIGAITDAELAHALDLASGRPPRLAFERIVGEDGVGVRAEDQGGGGGSPH